MQPPRPFASSRNSQAPYAPADEPPEKSGRTSLPRQSSSIGFWSLIVTQFQTAFNDNALKFLVIYIIVAIHFSRAQRELLISVVGALFALPFIFFSLTGGYFADKYSKRSVTIWTKVLEIAVMAFAIFALLIHSLPLECASVFLISSEAALFGPSKYGLLPELLPEARLSWGNGIIELGTFVASIAGTMASGILAMRYHDREYAAGLILLCATFAGLAASFGISRVPAADPGRQFRWNVFGELRCQTKIILSDRVLTWAVLGNSYLFFLAALLQFTIIIFGHDVLRVNDEHIAYLQAAVALGIGIGSVAAGYLSGGKIEYGLIPLGAVGMTVFGAFLYRPGQTMWTTAIHLALLGFFGGFFIVPMGALIQHRPTPEQKGGVIAAANLYSFVGIFLAAGAYLVFSGVFRQTAPGIFLDGAALTALATVVAVWMLPDSMLRLVLWMATHSIYRIHVNGRENVPVRGGALFVANHISLVDALLLIASTDRAIRFLIFEDIYNHPVIKPFAKLMHAIPVSSQQRPRELVAALHQASEAIRGGEIVCIFAEGQITRIGNLLPFRRGFERVMKGVDAPIVPVCLDGVWGSIFSFEKGRFLWKLPRRFPYPVSVSFGKPLASTATAFEVRQAVQDLQSDAFQYRRRWLRTLGKSLVRTAHRHPARFAMADMRR
ncbi:MAG: MFS transporter, partial [Candidatus Acidiferrales bacterium]